MLDGTEIYFEVSFVEGVIHKFVGFGSHLGHVYLFLERRGPVVLGMVSARGDVVLPLKVLEGSQEKFHPLLSQPLTSPV